MIEQVWNSLSEVACGSAASGSGHLVRRLEIGKQYVLTAAVDAIGKRRSIMILLDLQAIEEILAAVSIKGLKLEKHADGFGTHLKIQATETRFEEIFVIFANDIVKTVARSEGKGLKEVMLQRLSRWREFFQSGSEKGMSREAQLGLFGELTFMIDLLQQEFAPQLVLDGWCGPEGYPHDFKIGDCDIEIKTTSARNGRIHISNEYQLEDDGERLYLAHLDVDIRPSNGITLPGIVEQLIPIFEEANLADIFYDKLLAVGYTDSQKSLYEATYYRHDGFGFYHVEEGFPRIVASKLSGGISNVKYQLQINLCTEWKIGSKLLLDSMRGSACAND